MDPDSALDDIRIAIAAGQSQSAKEQAYDLADWITRGGFKPRDSRWRDVLQRAAPLLRPHDPAYR